MYNFMRYYANIFGNIAANTQKNCISQVKSPGFMATEACAYLAAAIILVACSSKIMHHEIIYMHKLLSDQYKAYQKINLLAELQQDLLLPAKIVLTKTDSKEGIKIIRNNQTTIEWQFKPNVQRGLKGSWTKLYNGELEYNFNDNQLNIKFPR
jgi:hypothetical protein